MLAKDQNMKDQNMKAVGKEPKKNSFYAGRNPFLRAPLQKRVSNGFPVSNQWSHDSFQILAVFFENFREKSDGKRERAEGKCETAKHFNNSYLNNFFIKFIQLLNFVKSVEDFPKSMFFQQFVIKIIQFVRVYCQRNLRNFFLLDGFHACNNTPSPQWYLSLKNDLKLTTR